ncbi:MAG TPA: L,D-transpeptidase [Thermoanaerobaculia bacterium]|jgi:hypothetical protein
MHARPCRTRIPAACALLLFAAVLVASVPFWGARESDPIGTDPATLRPGHFVWDASVAPSGPMVMVVSIGEQRADVYRNGVRIGVTTVSTGKPGHATPTGVFRILNKDKDHHSKNYDNAPMPYSERLTWDGVALHAGGLPGYPESHGCVHLPTRFAQDLFGVTQVGMTVVIANASTAPADVAHPAFLAPVGVGSGTALPEEPLPSGEESRWTPDASPSGPVTIVVSGTDRRILVYRNGIEIGRARITIGDPQTPLGTEAFVLKENATGGADVPLRWMAIPLPGPSGTPAELQDPDRIRIPPAFRKLVVPALAAGTTLYVTDAPVLEETAGRTLNVVNSDPPEAAAKR